MKYAEFVNSKMIIDKPTGLERVPTVGKYLFPFQREIVAWALRRGRAAIWADCGMGKTPMQLEWAKHVPGPVLILAPLAVSAQTIREGKKFGIEVNSARCQSDVNGKITVANYEMIDHFDAAHFKGVVLDESSILKSYMGKTKRKLIDLFSKTDFRLACTATPAPNDYMELGNHAEFLGVMDSSEILARWFVNDAMQAGNYRLKGHGEKDFWRWVSSWAVSLSKPSDIGNYSDEGYILPKLTVNVSSVSSPPPAGLLFHVGGTLSATEIHKAKRASAKDRAKCVADFADGTKDQVLIWCDSNYESDAISPLIKDSVDVRGSDSSEKKEGALIGFASGDIRVLITKPSIAGFGMNFQNCNKVAFIGLSYSFENLYQALRRSWRFGQKKPVEVLIVESESESGIRGVVERKIREHENMKERMVKGMREFQTQGNRKLTGIPEPTKTETEKFTAWNGDCVDVASRLHESSIDYSIFSPPFANLYIYSDSIADMGNCANHSEFFKQFGYLAKELFRITVNGRLCSVHCKDLPSYMGRDGAAGLIDFPGDCIKTFESAGWQYHSRVTIWKDPVLEMQRTKNHGLLHKQLCKDSSASRQGMADYLITFRKWDGEEFPKPVNGPSPEVRFDGKYVGEKGPENVKSERDFSIQVWQRYASPVWFDIRQTRVLQGSRHATDENDERHICPLQLDVIERAVQLWTNRGDVVFSPFMGIGSEGVVSLEMGRRFVGVELKKSYWEQACRNLESAQAESKELFAVNQ